jgi:hypothetical protein
MVEKSRLVRRLEIFNGIEVLEYSGSMDGMRRQSIAIWSPSNPRSERNKLHTGKSHCQAIHHQL